MFARYTLTPHKTAEKLAIHGNVSLPYNDREEFLLKVQLKVSGPLPRRF